MKSPLAWEPHGKQMYTNFALMSSDKFLLVSINFICQEGNIMDMVLMYAMHLAVLEWVFSTFVE
jgi:hypothetical protein